MLCRIQHRTAVADGQLIATNKSLGQKIIQAAFVLLWLFVSGCSSTNTIQQAHWQFLSGDAAAAAKTLASSDTVAGKDKLLYWLEKGMYLHYTGDYQRSNRELLKAADFVERSGYISLSDGARELLANEWASSYHGEYSEQLWIHSVLMMNFLHLGQYESAAVEARRALAAIKTKPDVLNNDHFTRSLIALSFEAAGQLNDAYIVNQKLAGDSRQPSFSALLTSQAQRLGFALEAAEHQQRTGNDAKISTASTNAAIVFIATGRVPQKFSGSLITSEVSRVAFPQYAIPASRAGPFSISVNGEPCDCQTLSSDLGDLVSHSLNKRGTALAAKSLLRAAAKDAVADAASDADEIVGELTRILLFALEEADTRSWRSLPRHFTMVRIPLPDSTQDATVQISSGDRLQRIFTVENAASSPLHFFSVLPEQFATE